MQLQILFPYQEFGVCPRIPPANGNFDRLNL